MKNLSSYRHIQNQHPQICRGANSVAKIKVLKFETKDALDDHFWALILTAIVILKTNTLEFAKTQNLVQK